MSLSSILPKVTQSNQLQKPIYSAKMMTKTILLFTVASVLLSNVVCSVVSDIQVFTDYDELASMDPEDVVTKVEITNERALETSEPADR